jgi:hypothetical protein
MPNQRLPGTDLGEVNCLAAETIQNCANLLPPRLSTAPRRRNLNQTLGYDNHRERGHEYSVRDALHQSELMMEVPVTAVTLHFSNQLTNA